MAKRLSAKKKKLLMFKDEGRGKRFSFFSGLLTFFFRISLLVTIVTSITLILSLLLYVLWPVLYIILVIATLGIIILSGVGINLDLTPFINKITPVITVSLCLCAALFVLRFLLEWFYILTESRSLNKNPNENAHYIAVCKAVKRIKISDIIVFAAVIISIVIMVAVINVTGVDTNNAFAEKALPAIALIIIIGFPIAGKIYKSKQLKSVNNDINALLQITSNR